MSRLREVIERVDAGEATDADVAWMAARLDEARDAIEHVLNRANQDANGLGRWLGPRGLSWEKLAAADASLHGRDLRDIRAIWGGR